MHHIGAFFFKILFSYNYTKGILMKSFIRKNLTEICTHRNGKLNEGLLDWLAQKILKGQVDPTTGKYIGSDPKIRAADAHYEESKNSLKPNVLPDLCASLGHIVSSFAHPSSSFGH